MQVIAGSNVIDISELHRKLASAEGILVWYNIIDEKVRVFKYCRETGRCYCSSCWFDDREDLTPHNVRIIFDCIDELIDFINDNVSSSTQQFHWFADEYDFVRWYSNMLKNR